MPVDAIRPPKKNKSSDTRQSNKRPIPKETAGDLSLDNHKTKPGREQLVWIIAGGITGLIFIIWLAFFIAGPSTDSSSNSLFGKIGHSLSELWETARTDWLKLEKKLDNQNTNSNANVEEERIQQLEEQVFPQFDDPSKH